MAKGLSRFSDWIAEETVREEEEFYKENGEDGGKRYNCETITIDDEVLDYWEDGLGHGHIEPKN